MLNKKYCKTKALLLLFYSKKYNILYIKRFFSFPFFKLYKDYITLAKYLCIKKRGDSDIKKTIIIKERNTNEKPYFF